MGCGTSVTTDNKRRRLTTAMKAAILIQRWYRRYIARLEMRQRYTWNIFQSIEYAGEQDQLQLSSFFSFMLDNFTQLNGNGPGFPEIPVGRFQESGGNLISHLLDPVVDPWSDRERQNMYEQITVPESYSGPHLTFPLTVSHTNALLSAFKEQQPLHGRYMLQLLHQTKKLLKQMPNVIHLSTPYAKEITICGDLHGRLDDLLLIFYKNGLPSAETPYVFNGDFVDRGKKSVEVIILLFAYQLLYPDHMTLNRGNHEDHLMNLRYGFTKEVMQKYKTHGRDILLLVQDVFSLLPIATVIDNKVLIVHGGISDMTDLDFLSSIERHKGQPESPRCRSRGQPESPRCRSRGQPESPRCRSRGQPESPRCRSRGQPESPRCRSRGQPESPRCRSRGQDHGNTPKKRRHLTRQGSSSSSSSSSLSSPRGSSCLILCRCLSPSMLSPTNNLQVPFLDSFTALPVRQPPREELEWKQVVDLLWSDPKSQPGCSPNTFRGGGSYFGPDVTRRLLERHGMTLLIRSHECKQEGYELCHDGQVITIFSASNYYEEGSNRGAYIKLGRELVPRFFQYQVSRNTRKLTLTQRVNVAEGSAVRAVQEKLFSHRSELMAAFQQYDTSNSGCISVSEWALVVESVVRLDLPWRTLRPRLARLAPDGSIDYQSCFEDMGPGQPIPQVTPNLAETLYRYRTDLEIIFNIMDKDHSGQISIEEFRQTWHLFSAHLGVEVDDRAIDELAKSIDFNKDGSIDFNEFLEAFRVVHKLDVKDQQQGYPGNDLALAQ
ncbi:serine/threonine-protein phosphatase with EF-hands 1-like isoform X3 [Oncorhynchus kisutch]|uniref:serine/threonine-protein phosphatase with EF-hands 1-like isoform X3 n=1 Tax=Oncorhynchus kisutch TaxID=8019 RepID=UPI0012DBE266|nr:serine/threonine-protein phosphatase with EF-hands 1-like isoform X3 [Oncorhynchus kisutch]